MNAEELREQYENVVGRLQICANERCFSYTYWLESRLAEKEEEVKQQDAQQTGAGFNCRFHPTDWWHEVGCEHQEWTKEQLVSRCSREQALELTQLFRRSVLYNIDQSVDSKKRK